jgi:hypothetical protein
MGIAIKPIERSKEVLILDTSFFTSIMSREILSPLLHA